MFDSRQSAPVSNRALIASVLALLFFGGGTYYAVRPLGIIHGPLMWLYKYPLIWKVPLLVFVLVFAIGGAFAIARRRKDAEEESRELQRREFDHFGNPRPRPGSYYRRINRKVRRWWELPALSALILAFLAWIPCLVIVPMLTGKAIYQHYTFTDIKRLPNNGAARIVPKVVAEQMISAGFNSSTEKMGQAHIVVDEDGGLSWTFGQVPNGTWRHYTAKTQGIGILDADVTTRESKLVDQEFDVSTDVSWTDNIRWKAYKRHFFTDVAETTYVLGPDGEPLLLAPYISYEGFWVKVPVLGGVYVVHPDGEIEDLSPEEARKRPFIVATGRLFPEALARRIQDSYQYKNGIWNRIFTHREQTVVADTESSQQPYLMSFGEAGTRWVSTAKPYGKSHATTAIFLTDTVSGETEVWHVPKDKALTGNARALEIVRGLSMPGVTFSGNGDVGGKFHAIEPRPIITNGRLQFMVSVVPDSGNVVTKTVIVDAASSKAVAIFNHDTDPSADQRLKDYLRDGTLPPGAFGFTGESGSTPDAQAPAKETQVPTQPTGTSIEIIERLLKENERQRKELRELQRQLSTGGRLLQEDGRQ